MTNILSKNTFSVPAPTRNPSRFYKIETLKNVANEYNFRQNRAFFMQEKSETSSICVELTPDAFETEKCKKQKKYKKNIKTSKCNSRAESHIVKSASHTVSNEKYHIPRSTSMQTFSPKKRDTCDEKKFNSLIHQKTRNQMKKTENLAEIANANGSLNGSRSKKHSFDRKLKIFEIGSTSSSTESISQTYFNKTGSSSHNKELRDSLRKVRSTSCISEKLFPLVNSPAAESLPNLSPKSEAKLNNSLLKYSSSSSRSTTSERSGWISSRYLSTKPVARLFF